MKPDPMETALLLIREPKCERTTNPVYQCITDTSRRPDAEYYDERWCNSCIAHHGLRFSRFRQPPNPAESGKEAGREQSRGGDARPVSANNSYARARG
jgi:hypothetical protein